MVRQRQHTQLEPMGVWYSGVTALSLCELPVFVLVLACFVTSVGLLLGLFVGGLVFVFGLSVSLATWAFAFPCYL